MLRESSIAFCSLSRQQALHILENLENPFVHLLPVRRAAKVFCRLTSENLFTYAREAYDLGTLVISKEQISSRLEDVSLQQRVLNALSVFESEMLGNWPFMPGSHSWLEIEISTVEKKVFINRAVRLTSLGRENITTVELANKVLKSELKVKKTREWRLEYLSHFVAPIEEELLFSYQREEVQLTDISKAMITQNACPLGFYMYSDIGKIRVTPGVQVKEKKSLPIPIVGVMK